MADIQRFVANLAAAYGARVKAETLRLYADKLVKFQLKRKLSDDAWERAMSKLVADCERFPELSLIYKYLAGTAEISSGKLDWVTYDLDGVRYAMRVADWFTVPDAPARACNLHQVVARPVDYQPCTQREARAAFAEGYVGAGGDMEQLDRILAVVRAA